ncbi:MAG: hypothetical protein KDJ25_05150 [Rhodoblastus sp.]|nr:hypothetical protein [Rhodoblastus sp.]
MTRIFGAAIAAALALTLPGAAAWAVEKTPRTQKPTAANQTISTSRSNIKNGGHNLTTSTTSGGAAVLSRDGKKK